ncbi:hypothetical protein K3181_06030 [Qipengyuania sp. YG27]|uniref:DUF1206 domain-containing protein n=1 Tax=Qipengyuania mesophila TaxID=2867246 RepID=A0ABS7JTK5_9SPHN|nr:hypothetical protein [Qipengyuania mesophila]MBX7500993.1 hypothetical protein [Qipengyuania mesophila]
MNRRDPLIDGWASIVRSTWRAFSVFSILLVLAILHQQQSGAFAEMGHAAVLADVLKAAFLLFLASFITALIFHYVGRRRLHGSDADERKN